MIYRSYGSVLHARHRGSKKDVAIKIIPVEGDLRDLMKEINILKSCKCNNIVRYYKYADKPGVAAGDQQW